MAQEEVKQKVAEGYDKAVGGLSKIGSLVGGLQQKSKEIEEQAASLSKDLQSTTEGVIDPSLLSSDPLVFTKDYRAAFREAGEDLTKQAAAVAEYSASVQAFLKKEGGKPSSYKALIDALLDSRDATEDGRVGDAQSDAQPSSDAKLRAPTLLERSDTRSALKVLGATSLIAIPIVAPIIAKKFPDSKWVNLEEIQALLTGGSHPAGSDAEKPAEALREAAVMPPAATVAEAPSTKEPATVASAPAKVASAPATSDGASPSTALAKTSRNPRLTRLASRDLETTLNLIIRS